MKFTDSVLTLYLTLRTSSCLRNSDVAVVSMSFLVVACWSLLRRWLQLPRPIRGCIVFVEAAWDVLAGVPLSVSAVNNSQLAFRKFNLLTRGAPLGRTVAFLRHWMTSRSEAHRRL